MTPINTFFVIKPDELHWRPSNMMKIPNADFLERTKSEILGARLWRFPPKSANTLHRHPKMEEFYFVIEGVGRMRIGDQTITVPKHGGVLVGPELVRQVFMIPMTKCFGSSSAHRRGKWNLARRWIASCCIRRTRRSCRWN